MSDDYPDLHLFIAGEWRVAGNRDVLPVLDPTSNQPVAELPVATRQDLDDALAAAQAAFPAWRDTPAYDRARILRRAGDLMRERAGRIGRATTMEQGKPLAESTAEALACADIFDWFAEEARRAYGRIVPSKQPGVRHNVIKEPVGPVAAFTPWNFPTTIPSRKMAAALAAGCTVIIKPAEETPASCLELARALDDAGLPKGVLNVVFGHPAEISEHLIASPVIKKMSFTGSTAVGKHLSRLAAETLTKTTMELGGHAPVIVMDDADIDKAAAMMARSKYRNAGQICITPTRFYLHEAIHDAFVEKFAAIAGGLTVGNGLDPETGMGPLANTRRLDAMEALIGNAREAGAGLRLGGERIGNAGNFWAPTVLTDVPDSADIMSVEPFGPVAVTQRFSDLDAAIREANRLPYGLSAYAFTASGATAMEISDRLEAGMIGVNFAVLTGPETPFGGIKDSGHGSEGGIEGLEGFLNTKYVAQA
ncbi:NAD-dependent succinate-semialdehyde dehydrogenase [Sinisalibacter aestuarii]|uniref:NAD-dependent succinate-semialdehyde dehydrogenase n=1 Tax=Sinisalibacter aestuarii TaxID=2949426 RepID=A0ABQ5LZ85_9RHOB|nr:NAD-dependent succinate-semialdehyde dehydrogenase [Sinisalibacter aestuarii]GKY89943.1 NAD-dependent succinate-semialdehyde dehydrogenase [Sinisalibacter aestuarii]